ncbi:MAG: PilN domain-containing protein [Tepidisphaerales bacterium]
MAAPNQLSFLPDDYLERKQRRRTNAICATLFVVVVGSVFAAWYFSRRSLSELEQRYTHIDLQYTEAAKRIDLVREMQAKQRTMAMQAELTASLLERVPRSHLLAEITNAIPAGLSLLEFDLVSRLRPPPPPAAADPNRPVSPQDVARAQQAAQRQPQPRQYDVSMRITGVAGTDVQVATFISRLNGSRFFKDVNLVVSEEHTIESRRLRRFTLEMTLHPDARVAGLEERGGDDRRLAMALQEAIEAARTAGHRAGPTTGGVR